VIIISAATSDTAAERTATRKVVFMVAWYARAQMRSGRWKWAWTWWTGGDGRLAQVRLTMTDRLHDAMFCC
jgi:hypothetical protein